MITQHTLMYGLNRSPTLAAFQKIPTTALRHGLATMFRHGEALLPIFISIHPAWEELVKVGAGADEKEQAQER